MSGDGTPSAAKWSSLIGVLAAWALGLFLLPATFFGQTLMQVSETVQSGTLANLHADKRVVQNGRWFLVREFSVQFAVRAAQQTYCGEISTTDATEAHDLIDSRGQVVEVAEKGKDLELTLKNGRRIRAHRMSPERCPTS
jgi:hypothetical protein